MASRKKWRQCGSVFPTRGGAVFCVHEDGAGHAGHHTGFRKVWQNCACGGDRGKLRCQVCNGLGLVQVKKNKHIGSTLDSLFVELGEHEEVTKLAKKKAAR